MKKIFLFIATATLAFSMNSCSSDDNSSDSGVIGGTISAKIDGVSKTFNTVVVNKQTITEDGETYTELVVSATIGTSTEEIITIALDAGDVGAEAIYSFSYLNGGNTFNSYLGNLSSTVLTNSNNKLKGNFSGTLKTYNPSNGAEITKTLSEGSFDISY